MRINVKVKVLQLLLHKTNDANFISVFKVFEVLRVDGFVATCKPHKDQHVDKHEHGEQQKFHRLVFKKARADNQRYNQISTRHRKLKDENLLSDDV